MVEEKEIEEVQASKTAIKDLIECLISSDKKVRELLTNLPIRQINPISRMRMHQSVTKILVSNIEKYQDWLNKRKEDYGGRNFGALPEETKDDLAQIEEEKESAADWLNSYLIFRRTIEGELQNHIVTLAQDQLQQEKPIDTSPIENFLTKE